MKRILVLATLALCGGLWAEPQQWNELGEPVALSRPVLSSSTATNAWGHSLSVWAQSQGQQPVVLGQMTDSTGTQLWEDEGRLLATGLRRAGFPKVIAVPDGWIVVWYDAEYIGWADGLDGGWYIEAAIFATKVDDDGAPMWPCDMVGTELYPLQVFYELGGFPIYPSGGGAIVTMKPGYDDPVSARGISAAGDVWPTALIISPGLPWSGWETASDGAGGLLIAWANTANDDSLIYANRLSTSGELLWGDVAGSLVANAHGDVYDVWIQPDGLGGGYLAWGHGNTGNPWRMQHLDWEGEPLLDAQGVPMIDYPSTIELIALEASRNGGDIDGALALFRRNDVGRLFVQKLLPMGERVWGEGSGIEICDDLPDGYRAERAVLAPSNYGGALVQSIVSTPNSNYEVRLAHVNMAGGQPWDNSCMVLDTTLAYDAELDRPNVKVMGSRIRTGWFDTGRPAALYMVPVDLNTGDVMGDPTTIIDAPNPELQTPLIAKLANGSTVVAWREWGRYGTTAWYQVLDVFGEPQRPAGGLPLALNTAGEPLAVNDFAICADGSGGFFAMVQRDAAGTAEVRAMHFNSEGEPITPLQGVLVHEAIAYDSWDAIHCLADGLGGCYVSLSPYSEQFYNYSVTTRINAQCETVWDELVTIGTENSYATSRNLLPGQGNSALLATEHYLSYPYYQLQLRQINPDGEAEWTSIVADSAYSPYGRSCFTSNGQNGSYVMWNREVQGGLELRAQLVDEDGMAQWSDEGIRLRNSRWGCYNVVAACDQAGNLTAAFVVSDSASNWIGAQRVTPESEELWGWGGRFIHETQDLEMGLNVVSISDNEVYIFWQSVTDGDYWYTGTQLFATHLNARGDVGDDSWWEEGGNLICEAGRFQQNAAVIGDGMGGAVVAWQDRRTGVTDWGTSVFAQRLFDPIFTDAEELPVVPTEFALAQNYPNPFNPETVIEFALPNAVKTTLKVYDVTGREVVTLVDGVLNAGVQRVSFNAQNLASGVYFYSLKAGEFAMTKKMVVLK